MSYAKAMRWHKKHPRGGKPQYMGFATGSGFWPSQSFLKDRFFPYVEECKKLNVEPFKCEDFYNASLSGRILSYMGTDAQAEYTKARRDAAKESPFD
jgi:hypothetical protein